MERQVGKGNFSQEELRSVGETGWRGGLGRERKIPRMDSGYLPSSSHLHRRKTRRPAHLEGEVEHN